MRCKAQSGSSSLELFLCARWAKPISKADGQRFLRLSERNAISESRLPQGCRREMIHE